jgi:hypothetical protein
MRKFLVGLFANLLLFGLAALAAIGIGEILARRISPWAPRTYAYSPTRGWKPLPHLDLTWRVPAADGGEPGPVRIRTDENGFRLGHEIGPKKPGVFRIAILGDSFTFGPPVHEAHLYPTVLERSLEGRTRMPVEVVNLGVPGYGVHQEHVTLEEQGLALHPDLVIEALYLGNDLQETLGLHRRIFDPTTGGTLEAPDHEILDGKMVPISKSEHGPPTPPPRAIKRWLLAHSRLYEILAKQLQSNHLLKPKAPRPLPPAERVLELWSAVGTVSLLRKSPPALENAWRLVEKHLDAMDVLCRSHGARFVVLVIPYKIQVVPKRREQELVRLALREPDLDLEKPDRRVAEWGRSRGVAVIDLLEAVRRTPDPASLYFRVDSHWSDKGHEVAGRVLADLLVARGLVPTR